MNINKLRIPIISLFTGGGFMDIGFIKAGFNVVFTNEFDKDFAELYREGMSTLFAENRSITTTESIEDLSWRIIRKSAFKTKLPKIWGVIGGPPCQDFSMNGNHAGFTGERGKLTPIFYSRIKDLRPPFFVMENVSGLLKREETRRNFDLLLQYNIKPNYYLSRILVNSIDFGTPQSRERVFVVGLRRDLFEPQLKSNLFSETDSLYEMAFELDRQYPNALTNYRWPKTDPFGSIPQKPVYIPDCLCVESCLVKPVDRLNGIANTDEYFPLQSPHMDIAEGETNRSSFKRLHRYRYSPTACYGNNEVHLHPYEDRRISVREALRIQGVPDEYVLTDKVALSKKFKMIGNGVPVPLAKAVATAVRSLICESLRK